MTTPRQLGEITLSTFRAKDGPLAKEVNKVIDWFRDYGQPDVLILSTILLAGVGRAVREELKIPVIGFLQGEDGFLDSLLAGVPGRCMEDFGKGCSGTGCLYLSKSFFAKHMGSRLGIS